MAQPESGGTGRLGERIAFTYLVSQKYTGEAAELEVLRKGEPHRMSVTLARPAALVPLHLAGKDPSFFIVAGALLLRLQRVAHQRPASELLHSSPWHALACVLLWA